MHTAHLVCDECGLGWHGHRPLRALKGMRADAMTSGVTLCPYCFGEHKMAEPKPTKPKTTKRIKSGCLRTRRCDRPWSSASPSSPHRLDWRGACPTRNGSCAKSQLA